MVEVLATPVTWVGMDVHMSSIAAAATIGETGELRQARLGGDVGQAVQWARSLPGQVRVTYEAGPAGFGLARALRDAGKTRRGATPTCSRGRRASPLT